MRGKLEVKSSGIYIGDKLALKLTLTQRNTLKAKTSSLNKINNTLRTRIKEKEECIEEFQESFHVQGKNLRTMRGEIKTLQRRLDFAQSMRKQKSVECSALLDEHITLLRNKVRREARAHIKEVGRTERSGDIFSRNDTCGSAPDKEERDEDNK